MPLDMCLMVLAFKDARILHARQHKIVFELYGTLGFLVHVVYEQFFRISHLVSARQEFVHFHPVEIGRINRPVVEIHRLRAL